MLRPSVVLVVDGVKGEVTVVSPAWADSGPQRPRRLRPGGRAGDGRGARPRPHARRRRAATSATSRPARRSPTPATPATSRWSRRRRSYIRAGDIFQVVPSQRWAQPFDLPPFALYRALRRTNPSPYMFYFNFGGFQVVGASPEILVRVKDGTVTIRPIAGTRPRGATPAEDLALEAELLADPKERAEHLMLLDLGRNDVGRVAKIGTRRSQRAVHHRALQPRHAHRLQRRRRARGRPGRALRAARRPARRHRLRRAQGPRDADHRRARGARSAASTAAASATSPPRGDMDICIALRTGVVKDGTLYVQAGGGVVYDSDPEAEFQESVNKAKALTQAARDAGLFVARARRKLRRRISSAIRRLKATSDGEPGAGRGLLSGVGVLSISGAGGWPAGSPSARGASGAVRWPLGRSGAGGGTRLAGRHLRRRRGTGGKTQASASPAIAARTARWPAPARSRCPHCVAIVLLRSPAFSAGASLPLTPSDRRGHV